MDKILKNMQTSSNKLIYAVNKGIESINEVVELIHKIDPNIENKINNPDSNYDKKTKDYINNVKKIFKLKEEIEYTGKGTKEKYNKSINIFTNIVKDGFKEFNSIGWYMYDLDSEGLKILGKIYEKRSINKEKTINDYMSNKVRNDKQDIQENLIKYYKDYEFFINRVFYNYDNENYCESIILGLILADGLGNDILEKSIYCKKNFKNIKIKIDAINRDNPNKNIELLILQVFGNKNSLNKSIYSDNINSKNRILNRHIIIHGKNPKYYSKESALKIISLLGSIAKVKEII